MVKFHSHSCFLIASIVLSSCQEVKNVAGIYQTNYPAYGSLTTKIKLKLDSTFERITTSKLTYDSSFGEYRVLDHKVFITLIWAKSGSYRYTRSETKPKTFKAGRDSVAYLDLYFIGSERLFFGNFETGKKETVQSSKGRIYLKRIE